MKNKNTIGSAWEKVPKEILKKYAKKPSKRESWMFVDGGIVTDQFGTPTIIYNPPRGWSVGPSTWSANTGFQEINAMIDSSFLNHPF